MRGVLSTVDLDDASLVAKAKASPGLVGRDLVREVVPAKRVIGKRASALGHFNPRIFATGNRRKRSRMWWRSISA